MVTFIKVVITQVEKGSPDMIPVAFDRKFDDKKDELPPEVWRPLKKMEKTMSNKLTPQK